MVYRGGGPILTLVLSSLFRRKNDVFSTPNGIGDGHRVRRSEEPVFCREQYSCHSPFVIDTVGIVAVVSIHHPTYVLLCNCFYFQVRSDMQTFTK